MGCVNNVYQHQQYLISCIEHAIREIRLYHLNKTERELLNRFLMDSNRICKIYRDRVTANRQKQIDKIVSEMITPSFYGLKDDLPF